MQLSIGVAGRAGDFAAGLVDYVVDYRNGEDALVTAVEKILAEEGLGNKVPYVFDAISENGSLEATLRIVDPNGGVIRQVSSSLGIFKYLRTCTISRILKEGMLTSEPRLIVPSYLPNSLHKTRRISRTRPVSKHPTAPFQ